MLRCLILVSFFDLIDDFKMASIVKEFGSIRPFDGSNFPTWKFGMDILLEKSKLTSVVDGTRPKPVEVMKSVLKYYLC